MADQLPRPPFMAASESAGVGSPESGAANSSAPSFENSMAHQFLIAMPGLDDENFNRSVTLLCEHSEKGALGLVINRPMALRLQEMLEQMGLEHEQLSEDPHVFWGGPVQPERGFVVHAEPDGWDSSLPIGGGLYITTSRDILAAIGRGEGPKQFIVTLGYAGWGAGQLEDEVLRNAWLNTPMDRGILFSTPANDRWRAATRLLGIDISHLASVAGHA